MHDEHGPTEAFSYLGNFETELLRLNSAVMNELQELDVTGIPIYYDRSKRLWPKPSDDVVCLFIGGYHAR